MSQWDFMCGKSMISIETLLSERIFETFFVQVIIKMKNDFNFTEIYNQIRAVKDVIIVRVVDNDKLDSISSDYFSYSLIEMKYISEGNAIDTVNNIKEEALKLPGLVKFYVRTNTLQKIRNY